MVMDKLLFSPCFVPGQYRLADGAASVSITPLAGEAILFFDIDDVTNPRCTLRKELWGDRQGEKICDGLVFYAKNDRRVLCFLELKENKSDFHTAVKQVTNTYDALKQKLNGTPPLFFACFIADHGSPSDEKKDDEIELEKTFGKDKYVYDGNNQSFAALLRGEPIKSVAQKRKDKKKRF